jgi:hypothetical protein
VQILKANPMTQHGFSKACSNHHYMEDKKRILENICRKMIEKQFGSIWIYVIYAQKAYKNSPNN